ncbi:hypothetical protein [Chlamydia suis]|uniref:Inclusion membrane protein-31 n=1 Tax=Chlamydia suis TaxID=83559 RepID=A0ABX6ITQ0_9CHLA|nr:hypothetical protein [Chlamydia suis]QHP83412.1 Inclusion membrane protein-31 [Chlamydia suis]
MIDNINGGFCDGCAPVSVSCRKENLLEPTSSELICGRVVAIALVVLGFLLFIAGSVLLAVGAVSCWLPPVVSIIMLSMGVLLFGVGVANLCSQRSPWVKMTRESLKSVSDKSVETESSEEIRRLQARVAQLEQELQTEGRSSRERLSAARSEIAELQDLLRRFQASLEAAHQTIDSREAQTTGDTVPPHLLVAARSEITDANAYIRLLEQTLEEESVLTEDLRHDNVKLRKELKDAAYKKNMAILDLRHQLQKLQAQLSLEKALRAGDNVSWSDKFKRLVFSKNMAILELRYRIQLLQARLCWAEAGKDTNSLPECGDLISFD